MPRIFQNPIKTAKTIAFSHGDTENTEKILPFVFSSEYSVFSVALCAYLLEHAKRLAPCLLTGQAGFPPPHSFEIGWKRQRPSHFLAEGTKNTEEVLAFSNRYSVSSVPLCET